MIRFVEERGAAMIAAVEELLQEKRRGALEAGMVVPVGAGAVGQVSPWRRVPTRGAVPMARAGTPKAGRSDAAGSL